MKGQISIEYLMLIGLILLIVIPLFYYTLSRTREDLRSQQAYDALSSLAHTADEVYSLGLGSRDFIWIHTPTGIKDFTIDGKSLAMTLSLRGATSDFTADTKANVTVTQDFLNKIVLPGTYKVSVETYKNVSSGTVMILLGGYCGDSLCSSIENADTCALDCVNICGDGVCVYPGDAIYKEACLTDYCSDCVGSVADCPSGKVCAQDLSGGGYCKTLVACGDGECQGEPYVENCNDCKIDCEAISPWQCCFDAVTDSYYRSTNCGVPPTVTSCPDWCVYIGDRIGSDYDTGTCAQTFTKCNDFGTGGAYVEIDELDIDNGGTTSGTCDVQPKPPGDGKCDGDEFCVAGDQADTCCCIFL